MAVVQNICPENRHKVGSTSVRISTSGSEFFMVTGLQGPFDQRPHLTWVPGLAFNFQGVSLRVTRLGPKTLSPIKPIRDNFKHLMGLPRVMTFM